MLIFAVFVQSGLAVAQVAKKLIADKQRSIQWKPEKGQYYFSHSMVLNYENKTEKTKGAIKIYLDPISGAMCFRKESSFGQSGEAYDFILAFSDGRFIHCGTDENGKKIRTTEKVTDVKPDAETQNQQKENFETYCSPTGNKRTDAGFESVEYILSYATSENKDKLWLTTVPFNVNPLYGFELIEVAASLPVSLDYLYLLGLNQLISELDSKDLKLKLTGINADPFLALTRNYQEVKMD
ncbi:hypothetical protein E0F88_20005 [Dyadobacter psychrotolerans]|uniref:DUF4412 domain-containing protein n=1 Tax=Dyadobacter psychrotolerans TaxID=2541721 RepID=A0A4R5DMT7_9BACT|nr:hypothetical protein E0F88_20005 [Dyadobacter psychrotolerans]